MISRLLEKGPVTISFDAAARKIVVRDARRHGVLLMGTLDRYPLLTLEGNTFNWSGEAFEVADDDLEDARVLIERAQGAVSPEKLTTPPGSAMTSRRSVSPLALQALGRLRSAALLVRIAAIIILVSGGIAGIALIAYTDEAGDPTRPLAGVGIAVIAVSAIQFSVIWLFAAWAEAWRQLQQAT